MWSKIKSVLMTLFGIPTEKPDSTEHWVIRGEKVPDALKVRANPEQLRTQYMKVAREWTEKERSAHKMK